MKQGNGSRFVSEWDVVVPKRRAGMFVLIGRRKVRDDFDMDSLFDGDRATLDNAIYDWGIGPRACFLIESIEDEPMEAST